MARRNYHSKVPEVESAACAGGLKLFSAGVGPEPPALGAITDASHLVGPALFLRVQRTHVDVIPNAARNKVSSDVRSFAIDFT